MATHSSVLAWRIPGTEEPGGLPSMGSNRVGHDLSDLAAAAAAGHFTLGKVGGVSWAPDEFSEHLSHYMPHIVQNLGGATPQL